MLCGPPRATSLLSRQSAHHLECVRTLSDPHSAQAHFTYACMHLVACRTLDDKRRNESQLRVICCQLYIYHCVIPGIHKRAIDCDGVIGAPDDYKIQDPGPMDGRPEAQPAIEVNKHRPDTSFG